MDNKSDFVPRPYQQYAIDRVLENPCQALMMDMGLGKTAVMLTAMQELLYDRFEVGRVLVIAPLRVAGATWTDECAKWKHLKGFTCSRVLGTLKDRIRALNTKADFYIINRENVPWLVLYYGRKWPFDMVVIDESSSFKNPSSKRFKALRKVRPYIRRLVELTGTPAPNGMLDLWSQVYLLDGGDRLGKSMRSYRARFFTPGRRKGYVVYDWNITEEARAEILELISDVCVSMKSEDYLVLPPVVHNVVKVVMGSGQMAKYRQLEKEYVMELSGEELIATSAAAVSNKLLQLANGSVYNSDGSVLDLHDGKIEALKEIAECNAGKSVMVLYWFRHDLAKIMKHFPEAVQLKDGQDIRDWNEGRIGMLLVHPASAGHGLNLQHGGHIIVWYGLTWSLELYQQANKRLHRSGQEHAVIINHLVTEGTIDEDVMASLKLKGEGQDAMLEAVKARIRRYADDETEGE